jgi:hypothetical protein
MTDENGTRLCGVVFDPLNRPGIPGMPYSSKKYPGWMNRLP